MISWLCNKKDAKIESGDDKEVIFFAILYMLYMVRHNYQTP